MADGLEVHADLVGAPVSRRTRSSDVAGSARSSAKWVIRLARLVGVRRVPGAPPAVAADRRVDRPAARRRAALDEGQVLARDLAAGQQRRAARGARRSLRATTSSPDVSRSRRCTIPGRSAAPPPARPASAWLSVPWAWPRAGAPRRRPACR